MRLALHVALSIIDIRPPSVVCQLVLRIERSRTIQPAGDVAVCVVALVLDDSRAVGTWPIAVCRTHALWVRAMRVVLPVARIVGAVRSFVLLANSSGRGLTVVRDVEESSSAWQARGVRACR